MTVLRRRHIFFVLFYEGKATGINIDEVSLINDDTDDMDTTAVIKSKRSDAQLEENETHPEGNFSIKYF